VHLQLVANRDAAISAACNQQNSKANHRRLPQNQRFLKNRVTQVRQIQNVFKHPDESEFGKGLFSHRRALTSRTEKLCCLFKQTASYAILNSVNFEKGGGLF
jgi:hypothetical protein